MRLVGESPYHSQDENPTSFTKKDIHVYEACFKLEDKEDICQKEFLLNEGGLCYT